MIIKPPSNDTDEYHFDVVETKPQSWYDWFFSVRNWKCNCGLTNFGRNKKCAMWTCNLPRPLDFNEGESYDR